MTAALDLDEVKQRLKEDPNDPLALRQMARHCLIEGRYQQARDHFCQAVGLEPRLFPEVLLDYETVIGRQSARLGPRLSLAGFQIGQGEIEAAILELEEALEVNPKSVESYNVLGKILIKRGEVDRVIELLERSVRQGIRDVSLTEILAGAYLEKGRTGDAIRFYREVLQYRPNDKNTLRVLGELHGRLEEYNEAALNYQAMFSDDPEVGREVIQRLEELLRKQEGNVFIRGILAEIYMRSLKPEAAVVKLLEIIRLDPQKLDEVLGRLKTILKSYPGYPPATLALAEGLRRQGNFSEAVERYHDLVKNKPDHLDDAMKGYREVLEFCPEQVLGRTYLAEALLYRNQLPEALEQYERMLEADPTAAEAVIRRCREIIKAQPQLLQGRLVLGRAYLAIGDIQRAAVEAEGLVAADKQYIPAYSLLGEAYFKLKMGRKAVNVLGQALRLDPFNAQVQARYREAKERELEQEIENVQQRIQEDPWRVSLHLDLAKAYLQQGKQEPAIRELQAAVKDQARAPFAYNLLGSIYRGEGRYDLAAAQFNRALELAQPELGDFTRTIRFNLGTTAEAQGQLSKALKIYEQVLQEELDFGNLKERVKYLKGTSLKSMQARSLVMVLARPGSQRVIAAWGREARAGRQGRKEEMSLSFGQEHNTAGFDLFLKEMHKAAEEEFLLAVQLDVKFAAALNNLAVSLVREGKFYEARAKLADAVDIEPAAVIFQNNLGVVDFLLGQFDQAARELEKAYAGDPENSAVCLNLGDLCCLKKDIRRALDLYQRPGHFDLCAELAEERLRFKIPTAKME